MRMDGPECERREDFFSARPGDTLVARFFRRKNPARGGPRCCNGALIGGLTRRAAVPELGRAPADPYFALPTG